MANQVNPNTVNPNTVNPNTANPNTANPNAVRPNTVAPGTMCPYAARQNVACPYVARQSFSCPYMANPYAARPIPVAPHAATPTETKPNVAAPVEEKQNNAKQKGPRPDYIMKKSGWSVVRPWHILLGFLIVPLIIMIVKVINIKDDKIYFYKNKVVHKHGILNKKETTTILTRVLSVSVDRPFWGRIFNYGTIKVDVIGKWDIDMTGVKRPKKAKKYLESLVGDGRQMRHVISN